MSGPYGLYMYALKTCICSRDMCLLWRHGICCVDMVYALGTWDMLYGHGTCLLVGEKYLVSSCWRRIYGYGRCLLVGEEYMDLEDVFLLDKNI